MATYNKFQCFVGDIGLKKHDLDGDTIRVYLTNTAPVNTNTVFGTPAEIAAGNGYTAGGSDATCTYSQSSGTGTLAGTDIVFTAAGGTIGPFRYAVLYNDTAATNALIAWWDYGSGITLNDTETFTVDFGASIATLV